MTNAIQIEDNNPGGIQPWSRRAMPVVIFAVSEYAADHTDPDAIEAGIISDLTRAGIKVVDLHGVYKGKPERSYMVTLSDYEGRVLNRIGYALQFEETILLLGSHRDSRARREATLCHPVTLQEVAALGYMGEVKAEDRDQFEGLTTRMIGGEERYFTAMPFADWCKYEDIKRDGVQLAELGADWRNASKLWTCSTGVHSPRRTAEENIAITQAGAA